MVGHGRGSAGSSTTRRRPTARPGRCERDRRDRSGTLGEAGGAGGALRGRVGAGRRRERTRVLSFGPPAPEGLAGSAGPPAPVAPGRARVARTTPGCRSRYRRRTSRSVTCRARPRPLPSTMSMSPMPASTGSTLSWPSFVDRFLPLRVKPPTHGMWPAPTRASRATPRLNSAPPRMRSPQPRPAAMTSRSPPLRIGLTPPRPGSAAPPWRSSRPRAQPRRQATGSTRSNRVTTSSSSRRSVPSDAH